MIWSEEERRGIGRLLLFSRDCFFFFLFSYCLKIDAGIVGDLVFLFLCLSPVS